MFTKWLKTIDPITFANIFAIIPLLGDIVWWIRDYLLGEWTWHLGYILPSFTISLIGCIIALIWHYKHNNKEIARINHLEQIILELQHKVNTLSYNNTKSINLEINNEK